MRIGIDASRAFVDQPTGTERYAYEIITNLLALPEAGKHQWILYVRPNFQFSTMPGRKISNFKMVQIPMKYLWTQVGLAARTWIDKLDLLWVPAHTLPILRKPGMKTVVTIHGIEYEWLPAYENRLQRWYLPLSTQYAVKAADKLIAVSGFTKKQLIERLGAEEKKITVIYEGVNQNSHATTDFQLTLATFGLKTKKYILFIGTIQPRKNLVRLIEAYSQIKTDQKLVIAGKWGWMYREVQLAPEKYGVAGKVVFTGYINDTDRYILLQNASVYVQPSITEGFGLPILEAWQEKLPVVSSWGGALEEVVGKAGLLFDPESVANIKEKLEKVMSNAKLAKDLGDLGGKRLDQFSWKEAAKDTLAILENLE